MMVMRKLRKKMRTFLWFAIVVFVGGMTAMMVGGGGRKPTPTELGKVGEISAKTTSTWQKIQKRNKKETTPLLYRDYSNLINHYKKQGIPNWKCKDLAFNSLIEEALVVQEIKKRGIEITDEEVVATIRNNPPPELLQDTFLLTNGRFDHNKYLALISNPSSTQWLQSYELIIRNQLPREILYQTITASARPTTIDFVEVYVQTNLKLTLEYALMQNKAHKIQSAELLEYYNTNKDEFSSQKEPLIEYVVFPVPISTEDKNYTKEIAEEIADFAQDGASLENLATEYTCQLVTVIQESPTQGLIKKEDGYHIIKGNKELILPIRPSDESFALIEDEISNDFIFAAKSDFLTAAKSCDLEVHKVGATYAPIKTYIDLTEKNKLIGPIEGIDCLYVIHTLGIQKSYTPDFPIIAEKIRDKYQHSEAKKLANKLLVECKGNDIIVDNSKGNYPLGKFKEVLQTNGFQVETIVFNSSNEISSSLQELFLNVSNLPENETGIVSTKEGIYLVHCLNREEPTQAEIEKAIPTIYPKWMKEEKDRVYAEWLTNSKANVNIKDYRYKVY